MKLLAISKIQAGLAGLLTGIFLMAFLRPYLSTSDWWPGHDIHDHDHDESSAYHTHADFLIVMNGTVLDLADPAYMSTAERVLAPSVHLHDEDGSVVHYHAPELTFASFLDSLDITLTDNCLTVASQTVCTDDTSEVALFVNGQHYPKSMASYVSADLDRILLYTGPKLTAKPEEYLDLVEDRSCIFSGTCPERGVAPAESCGLTCEL